MSLLLLQASITAASNRFPDWELVPAGYRCVPAFSASFLQYADATGSLYNILWIVVFGFATLNIISLGARRVEPNKRSMNFGELLAVLVVITSVMLLTWELLHLFRIFPLHLSPR
jgi:hypothetical protein